MNFYYNFLRLCNEVGKSPSKVILEVGGTKSAITRWKNGGEPTDATMQKIANYFGVSVADLKRKPEEEIKKAPTPEGERDELKEKVFRALETADPAIREAALRLLGVQE